MGRRGGGGFGGGRSRSRSPPRASAGTRSSSGSKSASSSKAPAKKDGMFSSLFSKGKGKAPAPAKKAAPAPAPAQQQQGGGGGGMGSGLGGMIMQGMAFGGGSAIAHRAVDAVAGPRSIHVDHGEGGGDTASAAGDGSSMTSLDNPDAMQNQRYGNDSRSQQMCGDELNTFNQCVQDNQGQLANCQFYYDILNQCKRQ